MSRWRASKDHVVDDSVLYTIGFVTMTILRNQWGVYHLVMLLHGCMNELIKSIEWNMRTHWCVYHNHGTISRGYDTRVIVLPEHHLRYGPSTPVSAVSPPLSTPLYPPLSPPPPRPSIHPSLHPRLGPLFTLSQPPCIFTYWMSFWYAGLIRAEYHLFWRHLHILPHARSWVTLRLGYVYM